MIHRHPANVARYDRASRADRVADAVTGYLGSWAYLRWQTAFILAWIAVNAVAASLRWDPYPFILLNLAFSMQATYAAPLILLAGNRAAEHDRARAETDHQMLSAIHAALTSPARGDDLERTAP